jgi:predicted Holliday junction resolvase-like endonuclease
LLSGRVDSVVLVDIKSGAARLSKRQRQIRDAVDAGKVTVNIVSPQDGEERRP